MLRLVDRKRMGAFDPEFAAFLRSDAGARRVLQLRDRVRRPHVVFAAHAEGILAAGFEGRVEHGILAERRAMQADRLDVALRHHDVHAHLAFADAGKEKPALADMTRRWPNASYIEDSARTAPVAQRIFDLATRKYGMRPQDLVFEGQGVKVFVDPDSLPLIDGTTVDFVRQGLNEAFRFRNPNVKGECGCGESFNV